MLRERKKGIRAFRVSRDVATRLPLLSTGFRLWLRSKLVLWSWSLRHSLRCNLRWFRSSFRRCRLWLRKRWTVKLTLLRLRFLIVSFCRRGEALFLLQAVFSTIASLLLLLWLLGFRWVPVPRKAGSGWRRSGLPLTRSPESRALGLLFAHIQWTTRRRRLQTQLQEWLPTQIWRPLSSVYSWISSSRNSVLLQLQQSFEPLPYPVCIRLF